MKIKKLIAPLLVLLIAVFTAQLIISSKPEVKKKVHHKAPLVVKVMELKPQSKSATIMTQGTVEARTMTTLVSIVSGEVIWISDRFRPGGFFEKDDLLLRVDPIDYELAIKSAEAGLAEAHFMLQEEQAQAEQAVENWERLGRSSEPSDLVLRKPQLARASAVVESAKAVLARARLDLKRTFIKAPYAGRVLEQYVDVGQFVSSGNNLVKLFAIDQVEVRLPLTEKQRGLLALPRHYRGESSRENRAENPRAIIKATVSGQEYRWEGELIRTEGSVDRNSRQQYVVVQINDPYEQDASGRPPLEVGQFVKAELRGRLEKELFVFPRTAVYGENTVLIVDKDSRLQHREITILWEEEGAVITRQGLKAGELLCTSYVPFAANNTLAQIYEEPKGKNSVVETTAEKDKNSHGAATGKARETGL